EQGPLRELPGDAGLVRRPHLRARAEGGNEPQPRLEGAEAGGARALLEGEHRGVLLGRRRLLGERLSLALGRDERPVHPGREEVLEGEAAVLDEERGVVSREPRRRELEGGAGDLVLARE